MGIEAIIKNEFLFDNEVLQCYVLFANLSMGSLLLFIIFHCYFSLAHNCELICALAGISKWART